MAFVAPRAATPHPSAPYAPHAFHARLQPPVGAHWRPIGYNGSLWQVQHLDRNGDGIVSASELHQVLSGRGIRMQHGGTCPTPLRLRAVALLTSVYRTMFLF